MIEATLDHSVGHRFLRAIAEREACNLICSGFRPIAAPNTKRSPGPA